MQILSAILAFCITLLSPGAGLVYARLWLAGITIVAAGLIIEIIDLTITRTLSPNPTNIVILVVFAGVVVLSTILLAVYTSVRVGRGIRARTTAPKWYRSTWIVLLVAAALEEGTISLLKPGWHVFSIPTPSSLPTLHVGDTAVCGDQPSGHPARGDVVVFNKNNRPWVKRVIGLPGETIRITAGIISINGRPATRSNPRPYPDPESSNQFTAYDENLPDAPLHAIISMSDTTDFENTQDVIVPPNAYFVLGDNRDDSEDSRFPDLGFVAQNAMICRMQTIVWSHEKTRILTQLQ